MLHNPKASKSAAPLQPLSNPNKNYDWSDEAIRVLKAEFARHTSDSVIVRLLPKDSQGRLPTRNAVIGKRHRLGLAGTKPPKPASLLRPQRRVRKRRSTTSPAPKADQIAPNVIAAVRAVAALTKSKGSSAIVEPLRSDWPLTVALREFNECIPEEQRKNIFQLSGCTCKWPVGHVGAPDFFFCGGSTVSGSVYCANHALFSSYRTQESMLTGRRVANAIPKPS